MNAAQLRRRLRKALADLAWMQAIGASKRLWPAACSRQQLREIQDVLSTMLVRLEQQSHLPYWHSDALQQELYHTLDVVADQLRVWREVRTRNDCRF